MKRLSWTELFTKKTQAATFNKVDLSLLDDLLYDVWALGRNIILVWTPNGKGLDLLVVPYEAIGEKLTGLGAKRLGENHAQPRTPDNAGAFMEKIVSGPKHVSRKLLAETAGLLGARPVSIELPFMPGDTLPLETISALVKRYSITLVEDRAVALFDIVSFSRYSPLEQVTQLNSLAYSVNIAYSKLMEKEIEIRFARTNTGDGFYIWNRDRGIDSNVDLYHFMHLVLAENAIARGRASRHTVPLLRTCFHIGGHYEFYQSEGLSPTTYSYIVGDVTIELARMIEQARPGQILIGDFEVPMIAPDTGEKIALDAERFIKSVQPRLSSLNDLTLGDQDHIKAIKCYLTGEKQVDGSYAVKRYRITDKHGYSRQVLNAKVNIHRATGAPVYLGIQDADLNN